MTSPLKIAAFTSAAALAIGASPAFAADGLHLGEHGLTYQSADGSVRLDLGGRLHADSVADYDGAGPAQHTAKFRRARLELSGEVDKRFKFRVDHEFAGVSGWRNVWASYRINRDVEIKAGNFIAPFSLEDLQSSNSTTFTERSLANALTPGYGLGVAAAVHRGRWAATAGWFSDPIKNDDGSQRKRGAGLVARLTYAPVVNSNDVVNLGAALEHRTLDAGQPFRAQTGPEAAFVPTLIHTRGMAKSTDFTNLGLEAAWAHKSLLVQGQIMEAQVARAGAPDVTLRGGYVQGSWILTGQRYRYSSASGVIGDVALPAGKQALELAVRYSVLDLNSHDARGGIARDLTLGVNWYMNRNIRVMANYIRAKAQDLPVGPDRTADVFALRLQAAF